MFFWLHPQPLAPVKESECKIVQYTKRGNSHGKTSKRSGPRRQGAEDPIVGSTHGVGGAHHDRAPRRHPRMAEAAGSQCGPRLGSGLHLDRSSRDRAVRPQQPQDIGR